MEPKRPMPRPAAPAVDADTLADGAPAAHIEHTATTALIPYARNARTHSDAQIAQVAASIREFGFTTPVLIDADNTILAGHARVLAAQRLGLASVPALRVEHLSEVQRRAYVLVDNKLALNAGWDEQMLALEIEDLQDKGFDVSLTGFSDDELAALRLGPDEPAIEGLIDEDDSPGPERLAASASGDLWQLGEHRVLCGDATDVGQVQRLVGDGEVDMWLTDPPYNVAYTGKTRDALTIANDAMADGQFRRFLRDAYRAADAAMRPGAVFYIWHADGEGFNFRGAARDTGWQVRQCLIWHKQAMVLGRQDYHWQHEPCLYGWKDGAPHLWTSDRKQTTVLEFDRPVRSSEHPTMKPVALIEYQLCNNTRAGDVVLDSFGGSGTTLIAAEKHGRRARLMELDPHYVDVIVRRWQAFTGRQAVLEGTGETFDALAAARVPASGQAATS